MQSDRTMAFALWYGELRRGNGQESGGPVTAAIASAHALAGRRLVGDLDAAMNAEHRFVSEQAPALRMPRRARLHTGNIAL
jgi:hypothetical protein